MNVTEGTRILDVGGRPEFWNALDRLPITILNLPREIEASWWRHGGLHSVVAGDTCTTTLPFEDYDVVFSNSVLEHVGSRRRQALFARKVRTGPAYWVQVPAPVFPIEAHCRVLFWWLLPASWRRRWIWCWYRGGNAFLGRQMAGTRPITQRTLRHLFPDGSILVERLLGLPKSYYIYRRPGSTTRQAGR